MYIYDTNPRNNINAATGVSSSLHALFLNCSLPCIRFILFFFISLTREPHSIPPCQDFNSFCTLHDPNKIIPVIKERVRIFSRPLAGGHLTGPLGGEEIHVVRLRWWWAVHSIVFGGSTSGKLGLQIPTRSLPMQLYIELALLRSSANRRAFSPDIYWESKL